MLSTHAIDLREKVISRPWTQTNPRPRLHGFSIMLRCTLMTLVVLRLALEIGSESTRKESCCFLAFSLMWPSGIEG